MKKSTIWTIIVLMSIALVGLTSFQVYWINNALKLNKQGFKENVISSLKQVATGLERREVARVANRHIASFYSLADKQYKYIYKEEGINEKGEKYVLYDHDSVPITENWSKKHPRTVKLVDPVNPVRLRPVDPPNPDEVKEMVQGLPFEVTIVTDSFVNKASDSKRIFTKSEMVNVVIEQMTNPVIALHKRISLNEIDSLLDVTLKNQGIGLQYEFAVWDTRTDSLMYNGNNNGESIKQSELRAALFPSDLISNSNFLLLNFPGQSTYLYKQIWTTLAASILFILIIVSCFSYAIYIIFRQKKLSEIKNDFINNMTHELKTPIATVGLAVEALNEKDMRSNESTLLRYLGMIKEENSRLSNQVEKVLQSALLDKDTFNMKSETISFHSLITDAIEKAMVTIDQQKGSLKQILAANNDMIIGDGHHITNVLHNLIDNAIKYSEGAPKLTISTEQNPSGVILKVADAGIGMSKDVVKKIFDRFYRVPTGNRHDVKGFGLGLSYVKAVIDKHEGSIAVESSPNKGSTFIIFLPYGRK